MKARFRLVADILATVKISISDRIVSSFARGRSLRVGARDDPAHPTPLKDDLVID
jgi:hypothetical protein